MTNRWILAAGVLAVVSISAAAQAQGIVRGGERGAREGGRAAGPVGAVVGGVTGGVVGGVVGGARGVLGIPDRRYHRSTYYRNGKRYYR